VECPIECTIDRGVKSIESKAQMAALAQIEEFKEQIRRISLLHEYNTRTGYVYEYSMEEAQKIFNKYLNKINDLTKEYDLGDDIHSKFRREAAEIIYDAAMERKEYKWAASFTKKYGL
jgi:hypothetical protein